MSLKVRDKYAGKKGDCPMCGAVIHVPLPPSAKPSPKVERSASPPPPVAPAAKPPPPPAAPPRTTFVEEKPPPQFEQPPTTFKDEEPPVAPPGSDAAERPPLSTIFTDVELPPTPGDSVNMDFSKEPPAVLTYTKPPPSKPSPAPRAKRPRAASPPPPPPPSPATRVAAEPPQRPVKPITLALVEELPQGGAFSGDLVFEPSMDIEWPMFCIGCCAPEPTEAVALLVSPGKSGNAAGWAGAIVGGFAGGIVGAMIGGAIGDAVGGTSATVYAMPICPACRSQLSSADIDGLAGKKDGNKDAPPPVVTPLLTRQARPKFVMLAFRNADYGGAFLAANEGRVFDGVAGFKSGGKMPKRKYAKGIPTPAALPGAVARSHAAAGPLDKTIINLIKRRMPQDDLHVAPDIPPDKLRNARASCKVPPDERILGLIDCTVFASAKNSLVFGCNGVYFHNDWGGKSPGAGAIAYSDFPNRVFDEGAWQEVGLDCNQFLNISGSSVPKRKILAILESISRVIAAQGNV